MRVVAQTRKPTTHRRYEQLLRTYIVPALGNVPLRDLSRRHCIRMLTDMLAAGRASRTARSALAVLQALLTAAAYDDELIPSNPAHGLGRRLRLLGGQRQSHEIRALTADELRDFLHLAWRLYPYLAPLFEVYARAGLRLGEGLALRHDCIDAAGIRVLWTYSDKQLSAPKSGAGRLVEVGPELHRILTALPHRGPPWCFISRRTGRLWDATHVEHIARRLGRHIGLDRVHPHMLRHTYASLLLASGESPEWVSRQLGHGSLKLTICVYGRWIQAQNPVGLRLYDRLLASGGPVKRHGPIRLVPGGRSGQETA